MSENSLGLMYQLSMNSWSWLPRVGSTSSFDPLATTFSARYWEKKPLREKYPNPELFLVRIFLYSDFNTEIYFVNRVFIRLLPDGYIL